MSKDSLENKVKLSLLQAEKRLVDLELSVAELKETGEKLKDFDPSQLQQLSGLDELKQKVDDIEDLIMVETVGIEELKKMMTGSQPTEQQTTGETAAQPQELPKDLQDKMAAVEQLQGKVENIGQIEQQIQNVVSEISSLRNELTMMKTTAPGVKFGPEFQLLSTKIDNMKRIVDDLLTRKVELDLKIEGVERSVAFLHSIGTGKVPDDMRRELDIVRRDFSVINSRLDSLENVAHESSETMMKLESSMSKFESFEKASAMSKELGQKLDEFKFVENEMRRLSNRIESVYDNIDKRLDKVKNIEKRFPEVLESLENTNKELDKVRLVALERVSKDEFNERFDSLEKRIPDVGSTVSNLSKKIDESKIMILERAKRDELEGLQKKLGEIEKKIGAIKGGDLEKILDEKISEVQGPMSVLSVQISELLGRIVMLESRLGNIEAMVKDRGSQPIIIE